MIMMRIISRRRRIEFWDAHPDAEQPLRAWCVEAKKRIGHHQLISKPPIAASAASQSTVSLSTSSETPTDWLSSLSTCKGKCSSALSARMQITTGLMRPGFSDAE